MFKYKLYKQCRNLALKIEMDKKGPASLVLRSLETSEDEGKRALACIAPGSGETTQYKPLPQGSLPVMLRPREQLGNFV